MELIMNIIKQKMIKIVLIILIAILFFSISINSSVFSINSEFQVSFEKRPDQLAHIVYEDKIKTEGLNYLWVYANKQHSLLDQHRGAGYLEGYMTYKEIFAAYNNFEAFYFGSRDFERRKPLLDFLEAQLNFMERTVSQKQGDLYWQYVGAYLQQCRYMHAGYSRRVILQDRQEMAISFREFYTFVNMADISDLIPALMPTTEYKRDPSCSIYTRLDDHGITVTHSTHNRYVFMLRIFKTYNFPTQNPFVGSQTITFTSRPASLHSKDDFYLLSSGLKVMETSLQDYDRPRADYFSTSTVPVWLRATVAGNLAKNSQQWVKYFSNYNSGTHNNQWIIVDPRFINSNYNLVIMLEQAYSLIKTNDMTQRFKREGYIGSYNRAYDIQIINKLGYDQQDITYDTDLRAKVIRNIHPKIKDLESLKYWSTVNSEDLRQWQGLAPRYDCIPQGPEAFGAIDCKIMTPENEKKNSYWAISSPPTSYGRYPPFNWDLFPHQTHEGMPKIFNFTWVQIPIDIQKAKQAFQLHTDQ